MGSATKPREIQGITIDENRVDCARETLAPTARCWCSTSSTTARVRPLRGWSGSQPTGSISATRRSTSGPGSGFRYLSRRA